VKSEQLPQAGKVRTEIRTACRFGNSNSEQFIADRRQTERTDNRIINRFWIGHTINPSQDILFVNSLSGRAGKGHFVPRVWVIIKQNSSNDFSQTDKIHLRTKIVYITSCFDETRTAIERFCSNSLYSLCCEKLNSSNI
jgi:hypothetical protein